MNRANVMVLVLALVLSSALLAQASVFGDCEDACLADHTECASEAHQDRDNCEEVANSEHVICRQQAEDNLADCLAACGGVGQPTCGECHVAHMQDVQDCDNMHDSALDQCGSQYAADLGSCTTIYNSCRGSCPGE
jgi:hypothetical protein